MIMQRFGFFLKSFPTKEFIYQITEKVNASFSGIWVKTNITHETKINDIPIFQSSDDLLQNIDIAIITVSEDLILNIASQAIKQAVSPILLGISELNYALLNQIRQLALEMGIHVGFSYLGEQIENNLSFPSANPIIAHFTRNINDPNINSDSFQARLKFDIATTLKLTTCNVRKIRAYSVPFCSAIPNTLMVFADFSNNSVITYTLNTNSKNADFNIQLYTGNESRHIDLPPIENPINPQHLSAIDENQTKQIIIDINNFIKCIEQAKEPIQNITLALETLQVVEFINSKINP